MSINIQCNKRRVEKSLLPLFHMVSILIKNKIRKRFLHIEKTSKACQRDQGICSHPSPKKKKEKKESKINLKYEKVQRKSEHK